MKNSTHWLRTEFACTEKAETDNDTFQFSRIKFFRKNVYFSDDVSSILFVTMEMIFRLYPRDTVVWREEEIVKLN